MRAVALRCPYCHCGIDARDEIIRCSKCRTIHHTSCWFENHQCSVFACKGEASFASALPIFIQLASPILLLFLAFFPDTWSFFAALLIPAVSCSIVVVIRFIHDLFSGRFMHVGVRLEYMLLFLINFISICCVIRVLVGQ